MAGYIDDLIAADVEVELAGARRRKFTPALRVPRPTSLIAVLIALVLGFAFLFPVASILVRAFSSSGGAVLASLVTTEYGRGLIIHTLTLGGCVGVVGTAIAFLLAYVQARVAIPGKKVLHVLALLPVVSPPFAAAMALIILFGTNGVVTRVLGIGSNLYGLVGLTLSLALAFFPVSYINLLGMLRNLDPSLDEAALSLGATGVVRFLKVTLPMMMPGLVGSFLLFFVEALADLANPLVIGGNYDVLSKAVYQTLVSRADFDGAAGYALALLVPGVLLFLVQRYWVGRRSVVSVTGKPAGRQQLIDKGIARPILAGAAYAIGLLIVAIYLTILLGGFVRYIGVDNTFTLENFRYVLFGLGLNAVTTTTSLAAIATPVASVLGLVIAWLSIRHLKKSGGALDLLGMLGIAVPGTVIGIGYAIAFSHDYTISGVQVLPVLATGGAVLGGQLALVMVFVVRSVPAALRGGVSSISQVDPAIEEAATTLGAGALQTWRKVTLPLIRPALVSGAIYGFARAMTTLSPVIFITSGNLLVISVAINNEVSAAKYGIAFAYCAVLIAIVLLGIGLISLLLPSRRRFGTSRLNRRGVTLRRSRSI